MTDLETPGEPTTLLSVLRPRCEAFEYGILPISKLVFNDPIQTLGSLKQKLASQSPSCRVDSATLADALQITPELGKLVIDTLSSVHHSDSDPSFAKAKDDGIDEVGADVRGILLFLYIQSYKKLLPRSYKDPAAVADVWPSTSAFDGCLSAMSPLQLARSNSRRFMPSQTDEEAHQLSYLQKHLQNLLTLLADILEGEGEDSKILTMENFEHLGLLMHFGDKESEEISIKQAAPFFTKPDPDTPAAPVPIAQVQDWLMENIASALEHITDRVSHKENGPSNTSDQEVSTTPTTPAASSGGPCFIEGLSKSSLLKQASELKESSVKVLNCNDSVVYILAPLRYATVYGCSDSTLVLGAVGKAVRVEHCERVHVIVAAKRVCIANCRECIFYLGVNQQPLIVGENHKLKVAPYNTFYSRLEEHLTEAGIDVNINKWNEPLTLGKVDPQDSSSHPAGVSDAQAEPATHLDPDQFLNFLIPSWYGGEPTGSTDGNPFHLPAAYMESQQKFRNNLDELKQALKDTPLVEGRKRELLSAIHVYFKDWLYASGSIRQLYCLHRD